MERMKIQRFGCFTALLLACSMVLSGVVAAQKVTIDQDKSADFSKLRTYAWIDGRAFPNELTHAYTISATDEALGKKGWKKVDFKAADALISYNAVFDTEMNISGFLDPTYVLVGGMPVGYNTLAISGTTVGSVSKIIKKGDLDFELYNKADGKLLWSANAKGTAKQDRSKRMKQFDDTLEKIFDGLPPAGK
jgi:hypothetical protein